MMADTRSMTPDDSPEDPLAQYLDNIELLSSLTAKREELEARRELLAAQGYDVATLLETVDIHRDQLQVAISRQEALMDEALQAAADQANDGRELFVALAELMKAIQRLTPAEWAALPAEKRAEWQRLLAEFAPMRQKWLSQLTTEERAKLGS